MEYVGIESIKRAYRDILQERGDYELAAKIERKDFLDPVFEGFELHPEAEMDRVDFNLMAQKIGIDLFAIDSELASAANNYQNLMDDVLTNLASVDEIIAMEQERIEDINIILGNFKDFSGVVSFKAQDLTGTCSAFDEYTFTVQATTRYNVPLTVDDVSGNGYEGNKYVYNNGYFEQEALDTSNRNNIVDESSYTYYEYSRVTAETPNNSYPADVNYDSQEAECSVVLVSNQLFNTVKIQSDFDTLEVSQISVSNDGISYIKTMDNPIQVNNSIQRYDSSDYIYGSGVLCFPSSKYAKISFKSHNTTNDNLAFKKLIFDSIYVDSQTIFNIAGFVKEYLGPLSVQTRLSNSKYYHIYPSIVMAISLGLTRGHAFSFGMYNFFMLAYDSDISEQLEDNGRCAFNDSISGMRAVFELLTGGDFKTVTDQLLRESQDDPAPTDTDIKDVMGQILELFVFGPEEALERAWYYYKQFNLSEYDNSSDFPLTEAAITKYSQFFKRYDEQHSSYSNDLEDAESLITMTGAKRHVIRLNDITAFANQYSTSSYIQTAELLGENRKVNCIAVFASEYIPPTFPSDAIIGGYPYYFVYTLTINGVDYEVVPVNSHRSGTKIIRYSGYSVVDDYTLHISEPIKSAVLTVQMNTYDTSYSPYLSNLKVCLGKPVIS